MFFISYTRQRIYLVYILIHFLVSVNAQITISISIRYYKTKYLDHNGGCRCIDTCEDALLWEGAILSSDAGKLLISFNVKFFIQNKFVLLTHILEILHCSTIQIAAVEGIKRFSGNPSFKFFYGMALVMEGRVQEGIRELDPLQTYSEVSCFDKHTTVNSLLT